MKKSLITSLILCLLTATVSPVIAQDKINQTDTTQQITVSKTADDSIEVESNVKELESIMKEKYSAYSFTITNNSQTPMLIENIKIRNSAGDVVKVITNTRAMSKTTITLLCLIPFTLGLSGIIDIPFAIRDSNDRKKVMTEVMDYSDQKVLNLRGEIINPNGSTSFEMITDKDQKPLVEFVFQNTKTHDYISMSTLSSVYADPVSSPNANNVSPVITPQVNAQTSGNVLKTDNNLVKVESNEQILKSIMKKKYSAYNIKVTSNSKNPLLLENIKISNGVDDIVKAVTNHPTTVKNDIAEFTTIFVISMCTFGLSDIIIDPILFAKDDNNNKKALKEATDYSNKKITNLRGTIINPNDSFSFNAIADKGQKPKVEFIFKDTKTHDYITVKQ